MIRTLKSFARQWAGIFLVALVACLVVPSTGLATDVYFVDFTAFSPNRQLRLEAKSPDNAGERKAKPFAQNFVYKLYKGKAQEPLWELRGATIHPTGATVRDDGWVVIHTHWYGLIFVDPKGRETGQQPMCYAYLSKDATDKYIQRSTAGPMWGGYSHRFFADVGDRPYYCIRTWWMDRALFDMTTGKKVPDKGELKEAIDAIEKSRVLKMLADAAKLVRAATQKGEDDVKLADAHPVAVGAYMAGRLQCKDAVEDLRTLEAVYNLGHGVGHGNPDRAGQVYPMDFWALSVRQMAQLSLRRLGQRPSERPATELNVCTGEGKDSKVFKPLKHAKPRSERVADVKVGQTALEVLQLIGPPDHIDTHKQVWEFDIDGKSRYTLRLQWAHATTVDALEKVEPPVWKVGQLRDEGLNNR